MMLLPVILGLALFSNAADAVCTIDPFAARPMPLLIRLNNFVYPAGNNARTITFRPSETVDFACPGGRLVLGNTPTTLNVVTATCVAGTTFTFSNGHRHNWPQVRCTAEPTSTARKTGRNCATGGKEVEIGFAVSSSRFVRTMVSCFDDASQSPINCGFELIPAVRQQVSGIPRPMWSGSGIFTLPNINTLYTQNTQRVTINGLLGLPAASTKYVIPNRDNFLSRGHLTARTDFLYPCQQNSTFFFVNSLPQWQTFNGGNWEQAEKDVQNLAAAKNAVLQVWTGGHGVATLPHERTGVQTPLFLYASGSQRKVPVPECFWKVVYDPRTGLGVVLIGSNNPYKTLAQTNKFCPDKSATLGWLRWNANSQALGFSWACTIPDFRKVVTRFPNVAVSGLLT